MASACSCLMGQREKPSTFKNAGEEDCAIFAGVEGLSELRFAAE